MMPRVQLQLFLIAVYMLLDTGLCLFFLKPNYRAVKVPVDASKYQLRNGEHPKPLEIDIYKATTKRVQSSPEKTNVHRILSKDKGVGSVRSIIEQYDDNSVGNEVQEITQKLKLLHKKMKLLQGRVDGIEEQSIEEGTSFMACAENGLHKYNKATIIQYKRVTLNEGQSYDANTSIFTCPVQGIYRFDVTVYVPRKRRIHGRIMVHGKEVADISVNAASFRTFGSRSVLVECGQDHRVKFETRLHGRIFEYKNRCLNSFSGHLVKMT